MDLINIKTFIKKIEIERSKGKVVILLKNGENGIGLTQV